MGIKLRIENVMKKQYDILDTTKYIAAFFIIAIHCDLYADILYPWLRLAVPMFFTISSFLFFERIKGKEGEEKKHLLLLFVKRNLILYAVWFVIQLPITVYHNLEWFGGGVMAGIIAYLQNFFLGSTFLGSWFIMANLIAVILIFFASRLNTYLLLIITGILNVFCCFASGYQNVIPFVGNICSFTEPAVGYIECNFLVALFWVALGKAFSDGRIRINLPISLVGTGVSLALLYTEYLLTKNLLGLKPSRDCFFALIPCIIFMFSLLLRFSSAKIKHAVFFRKVSILLYVTHYPTSKILFLAFGELGIYGNLLVFLLTAAVSHIISVLIIKLSERPRLELLKYLY